MMKRPLTLLASFAVALVSVFFAIRLWDGGAWINAVTHNPEAYPATGRLFTPWVKQYFYSVAFLGIGAAVSVALRPGEWRRALQPWLIGGVVLSVLAALAIAASPTLRVYATARDEHGLPVHWRIIASKQVPVLIAEAVALSVAAVRLRRQNRRRAS